MLLIANLVQPSVGSLADAVAGADTGLLSVSESSEAEILRQISEAVPNIPWGGWLKKIGGKGMKQLIETGCDFVVFPADKAPLALLQNNDEIGKVLEVKASLLGEGLLGAVNELPVDAVLIAGEQSENYFLTWHRLMLFQRFADLLTKPLLVPVSLSVLPHELQALWEAGVDGVVVEVNVEQSKDRLKKLRQEIDKLAFPLQHKQKKAEALLPYTSGKMSHVSEGEEE
jgi:hypothetical protein